MRRGTIPRIDRLQLDEPDWPESISGARCPDCGRFVGSLVVHYQPDPFHISDPMIDLVAAICRTHGRVIATDWTPWP